MRRLLLPIVLCVIAAIVVVGAVLWLRARPLTVNQLRQQRQALDNTVISVRGVVEEREYSYVYLVGAGDSVFLYPGASITADQISAWTGKSVTVQGMYHEPTPRSGETPPTRGGLEVYSIRGR